MVLLEPRPTEQKIPFGALLRAAVVFTTPDSSGSIVLYAPAFLSQRQSTLSMCALCFMGHHTSNMQ